MNQTRPPRNSGPSRRRQTMFRRRRSRPGRPLRPGRLLRRRWRRPHPAARAALLRLQQAHTALARAEFAAAAAEFESLADEAETLGYPRAPALHFQAGTAWYRAGQPDSGLARIRRGLALLADSFDPGRARRIGERVVGDLAAWGMADASAAVREEVSRLRLAAPEAAQSESGPLPRLPAKCPHCGGNVHSGEVEWADVQTAICDYCGSPLPASG